jgi:serine/threonine protein kinase
MDYSEKWEIKRELGKGGQGKVFLVSNKLENLSVQERIVKSIAQFSSMITYEKKKENFETFRDAIIRMLELEDAEQKGALKVLHLPKDARDPDLAMERIKREIQAMSDNLHPNLLKIVEVDSDYKWYVSKFYRKGSLAKNRHMFKGDILSSLKAIYPLVEGVAELHKNGYVHRDIKPENIFIDANNQLILGDFGLVYYEDDKKSRFSKTFENVGSRDWMPGWAMSVRIDKVKPTFDVFSLGKVIWSMVSGKPILPLWYYLKEDNDLEKIFPDSPNMRFANDMFAECIIEEEDACLPNASFLLEKISLLINAIEICVEKLDLDIKRTCRVCGVGTYQLEALDDLSKIRNFGFQPSGTRTMRIFTCNHCGHVQLFSHKGNIPPAWNR